MGSLLSRLPAALREQLLADLSYLNLSEIRAFCTHHKIPYKIEIESADGGTKVTSDTDRKPVVLGRVRAYLMTGTVPPPTRLPADIVRTGPPPADISAGDRLYYRWYSKAYPAVLGLLTELTASRFRNGALARVLIMEFWTRGQAPTFREFADAWLSAAQSGRDLLEPEYAFLADLRNGRAGPQWTKLRARKARAVLAILDQIT